MTPREQLDRAVAGVLASLTERLDEVNIRIGVLEGLARGTGLVSKEQLEGLHASMRLALEERRRSQAAKGVQR